jgi:hypothetical protein
LQSAKPALHDEIRQEPVEHVSVALARLHVLPHAPQSVSVSSGVSQPLSASPSQSPCLESHANPQSPAAHVVLASGGATHALLHAPQ